MDTTALKKQEYGDNTDTERDALAESILRQSAEDSFRVGMETFTALSP